MGVRKPSKMYDIIYVSSHISIKVVKMFGYHLSFPLSNIFKRCCNSGEYPDIWKMEVVTPAPKKFPPETPNDLRKISGTLNFSKIFEKFLAEVMISDMRPTSDPSQYGNEKGISTQHYLINMIDRFSPVLTQTTLRRPMQSLLNSLTGDRPLTGNAQS